MQERARQNEKVEFVWDSVVEEVLGEQKVEAVRIRNLRNGEVSDFRTDGLFVAVGHAPNTEVFRGQVELDEKGYVKTSGHSQTSVPGVFVAGDVEDYRYRQAVTAAADGAKAAMDAEVYLESLAETPRQSIVAAR